MAKGTTKMSGLADLWDQASKALSQSSKDYVVDPIQKALGIYVPESRPTELPQSGYTAGYNASETQPLEGFRRSTHPRTFPAHIPAYRGNEVKGGLETLPQARFDPRSPLKSDVQYWNATGDINAKPKKDGRIDYDASPAIKRMYAFARVAGAAKQLGLPSVDPDHFAAMILKEGRPNAGFNAFTPAATPDLKFRAKLDQYNIPEWQKDYLGMINYADRIAKKKKVPFDAVWNGLGRSADTGKTGFDYAKTMSAHQKAVLDPKNAQFRQFIHAAFSDGAKYGLPLAKDKSRDTDPYLKSDPEYKYHTSDGRLRKAEGGVVIDDGNPAKQRKLI